MHTARPANEAQPDLSPIISLKDCSCAGDAAVDDGLRPAVARQPDPQLAAVRAGVPQQHDAAVLRYGPQPGTTVCRAAGQLRVVLRRSPKLRKLPLIVVLHVT